MADEIEAPPVGAVEEPLDLIRSSHLNSSYGIRCEKGILTFNDLGQKWYKTGTTLEIFQSVLSG